VRVNSSATPAVDADRAVGLSTVRGIEVAELLRVITALHLDGLLTDAEFRTSRQRLVARH
jgi:hypothetical protein